VNIDSPNRNQVNIGNRIIPVDDPMNLAVQTDSVSIAIVFQAYQKATEVGRPMTMADVKGLSFHQSDRNWAFI
tara:strand:- start:507 stop:725 length:219 start_codon:yes stop_codon:yes gene_type:complete